MMSSQGLSEYLSEQYLEKQNPCLSLHMSSPHLTFGLGIKSLPREQFKHVPAHLPCPEQQAGLFGDDVVAVP